MLFVKQMDNVCREENLWLWQHAAYLPWEHQKNKKEVRTTPSIPVSSWNFEIFFQGPGKLLEKLIISQYSWNFKETFSSVFKTNQNLQMHLTHNCTFCVLCRLGFSCCDCDRNYLSHCGSNILIRNVTQSQYTATVAEITWFCFVSAEGELGDWVLEK